jgi:ketosteroid isomerase-like protein
MPDEDAGATLRALFDAINDQDLDRLESLHAEDYELLDDATGELFRGPAGARRNNEGWLGAFPDMRFEITNEIVAGEWAIIEATGRGTHGGPLRTPAGRIERTGRPVEVRFCTLGRVRNGRLIEGRDYYDRGGLMRQLGAQGCDED